MQLLEQHIDKGKPGLPLDTKQLGRGMGKPVADIEQEYIGELG